MPAILASSYKHMQNVAAICGRNGESAACTAASSCAAELLRVLQTATPTRTHTRFIKIVISKLISKGGNLLGLSH
jgi:RNA 3'-terminal phosphate cyclase